MIYSVANLSIKHYWIVICNNIVCYIAVFDLFQLMAGEGGRLQKPMSGKYPDIKSDDDDSDPNFDRKLDLVTIGARPYIKDHLLHRISRENCKTIVDYMLAT